MSEDIRYASTYVAVSQQLLEDAAWARRQWDAIQAAFVDEFLNRDRPKYGPPAPPFYGPPEPDYCCECGAETPGYGRTA